MMAAARHESSSTPVHSNRDGSPDYRPDSTRTTRPHAGESLEDTRNWPGLVLAGIGIIMVALTLTAAGYGFEGWAVLGAIVSVLCLGIGAALMVIEHRRIKALEGEESHDRS